MITMPEIVLAHPETTCYYAVILGSCDGGNISMTTSFRCVASDAKVVGSGLLPGLWISFQTPKDKEKKQNKTESLLKRGTALSLKDPVFSVHAQPLRQVR